MGVLACCCDSRHVSACADCCVLKLLQDGQEIELETGHIVRSFPTVHPIPSQVCVRMQGLQHLHWVSSCRMSHARTSVNMVPCNRPCFYGRGSANAAGLGGMSMPAAAMSTANVT
jgi:hypothetical protein